jgi:hypothetical protein
MLNVLVSEIGLQCRIDVYVGSLEETMSWREIIVFIGSAVLVAAALSGALALVMNSGGLP